MTMTALYSRASRRTRAATVRPHGRRGWVNPAPGWGVRAVWQKWQKTLACLHRTAARLPGRGWQPVSPERAAGLRRAPKPAAGLHHPFAWRAGGDGFGDRAGLDRD